MTGAATATAAMMAREMKSWVMGNPRSAKRASAIRVAPRVAHAFRRRFALRLRCRSGAFDRTGSRNSSDETPVQSKVVRIRENQRCTTFFTTSSNVETAEIPVFARASAIMASSENRQSNRLNRRNAHYGNPQAPEAHYVRLPRQHLKVRANRLMNERKSICSISVYTA